MDNLGRDDRTGPARPATLAAFDDAVFARLLDDTLGADAQRLVAPPELAESVMHRLDYRPSPDRQAIGASRRGLFPRVAGSRAVRRVARRAAHAVALLLVILVGFMINNTLPTAVHSAPTTVPAALESGFERQGARLDGLLREFRRAGPTLFVPTRQATPADGATDEHSEPQLPGPGRGNSNARATAPYRWV